MDARAGALTGTGFAFHLHAHAFMGERRGTASTRAGPAWAARAALADQAHAAAKSLIWMPVRGVTLPRARRAAAHIAMSLCAVLCIAVAVDRAAKTPTVICARQIWLKFVSRLQKACCEQANSYSVP